MKQCTEIYITQLLACDPQSFCQLVADAGRGHRMCYGMAAAEIDGVYDHIQILSDFFLRKGKAP